MEANIVALSGIAIAIGTVVDVGIVLTENIIKHLKAAAPGSSSSAVIYEAVTEVAGAVTTSVMTTIISFLPVITMTGEAGRLYRPLAYTKSFALIASIIVALIIIPPIAHFLLGILPRWLKKDNNDHQKWTAKLLSRSYLITALLGIAAGISLGFSTTLALAFIVLAVLNAFHSKLPPKLQHAGILTINMGTALMVGWLLAENWMPLGLESATFTNFIFVSYVARRIARHLQVLRARLYPYPKLVP